MGSKQERSKLYKNISASDSERELFKKIMAQNVHVYIQVVPNMETVELEKALQKERLYMEVTIVQALLIGLIYYLGANGTPWLTVNMSWALRRPLISGIMVGLILGDPVKGCIVCLLYTSRCV